MAVRGTASRGPCPQALGRTPRGPKAPVHTTRGSRCAGRLGEPAVGGRMGGADGGRRKALTMTRLAGGLPPARPLARPWAQRIAQAISMGQYQGPLVLMAPRPIMARCSDVNFRR